ncbi:hypothetical protein BGZ63DRAFT_405419 [Mariannaea sp. PMI_226]|nr:hypothetical protein BGZ63DRAFT_405419 [Mariannaea sp. PMI_226]
MKFLPILAMWLSAALAAPQVSQNCEWDTVHMAANSNARDPSHDPIICRYHAKRPLTSPTNLDRITSTIVSQHRIAVTAMIRNMWFRDELWLGKDAVFNKKTRHKSLHGIVLFT